MFELLQTFILKFCKNKIIVLLVKPFKNKAKKYTYPYTTGYLSCAKISSALGIDEAAPIFCTAKLEAFWA